MKFELKALTNIWTGGADRTADMLHLSGIKGSLRWWYETLVRGLDYSACDPTDSDSKCSLRLDPKKLKNDLSMEEHLKIIKGELCSACYLFGCTGWSSKFILRVLIKHNDGTNHIATEAIQANDSFVLEFLQQKKTVPAEDTLIEDTLITALIKLITGYGALGAKTVYKPSEIDFKNTKRHHLNFGIVTRMKDDDRPEKKIDLDSVKEYLEGFRKIKQSAGSPDLRRFWFVRGKHLTRQEHNKIVGRNEKGEYVSYSGNDAENNIFLGGFISKDKAKFTPSMKDEYKGFNAASKKIFSFHGPAPIERCFGYVAHANDLDAFIAEVIKKFPKKFSEADFYKGGTIISSL